MVRLATPSVPCLTFFPSPFGRGLGEGLACGCGSGRNDISEFLWKLPRDRSGWRPHSAWAGLRPSPVSPPRVFTNAKPRRLSRGGVLFCFDIVLRRLVSRRFGFSVLCRPGSDLLSRVLRQSTIGAEEFNGRVRNGIGFRLLAMTTRPAKHRNWFWFVTDVHSLGADEHGLMRMIKPIELLVPVSYMRCRTSTPGLSTWWSTTTLKGILVLRWVSRLDAFSGYPVRT